jgi:hypothetical protein
MNHHDNRWIGISATNIGMALQAILGFAAALSAPLPSPVFGPESRLP